MILINWTNIFHVGRIDDFWYEWNFFSIQAIWGLLCLVGARLIWLKYVSIILMIFVDERYQKRILTDIY